MKLDWWKEEGEEICRWFKSDSAAGLNQRAVQKRLEQGKNELEQEKKTSALRIFLLQFTDTMVLVLIGATILSAAIGAVGDAITIFSIVLLNAILGFVQEYQAEKSLSEMQKLTAPRARVIRDGKEKEIPASELVVGDIVLLETGDQVPADLRLLETVGLVVDESALTGESNGVEKDSLPLPEDNLPLAERKNMAFMGTVITRGRGRGVVVATG